MTIRNDTRTNDYFRDIAALAKAEGEGANSRPEFGRKTFVAASDGVIAPGKGKEDVGDVVKIEGKIPKPARHWEYLRIPINPRPRAFHYDRYDLSADSMRMEFMEFHVIRCFRIEHDGTENGGRRTVEYDCWRRIK